MVIFVGPEIATGKKKNSHMLTNSTFKTLKNAKILKKSHLAVCSIQNSFNRTSANIGDMDKLHTHVLLELEWTLTRDNFCLHLVNTCWLKNFYKIKCNEKIKRAKRKSGNVTRSVKRLKVKPEPTWSVIIQWDEYFPFSFFSSMTYFHAFFLSVIAKRLRGFWLLVSLSVLSISI